MGAYQARICPSLARGRCVARMAAGDARSTTAANNQLILKNTQHFAWTARRARCELRCAGR